MADDTISSAGDDLSDVSQPTDLSGDSEVDDIDSDSAYALSDDDESDFDWEEEWQKSVQELKYVVTGLAIPFVGRWFGRRFAFWIWTNYWEAWLGVGRRMIQAAVQSS